MTLISNSRTRQTWVDQARWAAIVLVVVGHAMGQIRGDSGAALVVSNFVYMFHIPVFVLLAGWGAARTAANGENLGKIFWQLLLPYIVFQLIAFGMNYVVEGATPSWSFTSQTFGLWFLVALAGWRLLAPWFRGIPYAVPLATSLALVAGLSEHIGGFLSLSRIMYFLPMFLLGPWLVEKIAAWRLDPRWRFGGAMALLMAAITTVFLHEDFWRRPFLGNAGYEALGLLPGEGMLWRLGTLVVGTALATSFMLVLPGQPGTPTKAGRWIADAGRSTMYPYLLHLPVLTVIGATSLTDAGQPTVRAGLFIFAAVLLCVVAASKPMKRIAEPAVEPLKFLKRFTSRPKVTQQS